MTWRVIRPAGEPIPGPVPPDAVEQSLPIGTYRTFFVQSGTAALSLALLLARRAAPPSRRSVLLPAYGCPDLVAAVVHAGLVPELVDTAPGEPFMNLQCVARQLGPDVLALVGVHFLGMSERLPELEILCQAHGVTLIEDSAQRIPGAGGIRPVAGHVIVSFGRGKPMGALGGGALLLRQDLCIDDDVAALVGPPEAPAIPAGVMRIVYNMLIRPRAYAVVCRLPGLGLGRTIFRPLQSIRALDVARTRLAVQQFQRMPVPSPAQTSLRALISGIDSLTDLSHCGIYTAGAPLLRYPLLCASQAHRDRLHRLLGDGGLGSSVMYNATLDTLTAMPRDFAPDVTNAAAFAARLLTLPVHSDVDARALEAIGDILKRNAP